MPTINDYKKKALNDAGYSGDINTAEWKWLKNICSPYVGAIPDMWRYALAEAGYANANEMLTDLGHTGAIPNKWYKYWRDTPLEGVGVSPYDPSEDSDVVLLYDWRRDDLVTYATGLVSQLNPVIGTGNMVQGTDANKPGYVPPAPFTFDGTDDYLELAACPMPTGSAQWYFAAVFNQTALAADTAARAIAAWGGTSDNTAIQVYRVVSGGVNRASVEIGTSASRVAVTDTSVDLSGVHYLECWYDGTNGYMSVDGGTATSALVAQNVAVARTRLGARGPNTVSRFWQGEGGLWLWRDSVPDAELRSQIGEYLSLAADDL